jgi:hypothetical protein
MAVVPLQFKLLLTVGDAVTYGAQSGPWTFIISTDETGRWSATYSRIGSRQFNELGGYNHFTKREEAEECCNQTLKLLFP